MRVAIAGAGIGGLTAGLCFAKAGYDVSIFEKTNQFADVGAGIQCGANAMHVFDYLGLVKKLELLAVKPASVNFRDYENGQMLHSMALGEAYQIKYGAPYLHIHRADLHAVLLHEFARVMPGGMSLSSSVTSFTETGLGVDIDINGLQQAVSADCLIVADGIHSSLRKKIDGSVTSRFTGNVAWRGIVPVEKLPSDWMSVVTSNFVGPQKHMVLYYLRGKKLANFVGVVENQTWQDDSWVAKAPWSELKADFANWHPCVQSIIDVIDKDECYRWPLHDHQPLRRWHSERVVLLGDAAHATLPFMASGAAMAIEDARVLQRAFEQTASINDALKLYQRNRIKRTTRIQVDSARAGSLYHFNSRLMRKAAFTALKVLGGSKQDFLPSYNANTVALT